MKFQLDYLNGDSYTVVADDYLVCNEFVNFYVQSKLMHTERAECIQRIFKLDEEVPAEKLYSCGPISPSPVYVAEVVRREHKKVYGKAYILVYAPDRGGYHFRAWGSGAHLTQGSLVLSEALDVLKGCSIPTVLRQFNSFQDAANYIQNLK